MKRRGRAIYTSSQAGSAIIGVVVALVFVSVVVAAMLRNTHSQSAASVGYGAVQTAHVTVSSGVIATEAFFTNTANADAALKMIDGILADDGAKSFTPYIYGKEREKIGFAENQFFNSRLADFNRDNFYSRVEVKSGRSARGRDTRGAHAFYKMGNLKIEGNGAYGGKNAVYMRGALSNGDNGMEVFGSATFEGPAKFQNSPGIFHGDAFFDSDAEFMHPQNKFYGKAYISGNAVFQNMSTQGQLVFEDDVGINGNLSTGNNGLLLTAGEVYVNGDFKSRYGGVETNLKIKSAAPSSNKKFHYSDNLTTYNPPPAGQPPEPQHCYPNAWACILHGSGHVDLYSNVTGFARRVKTPEMSESSIQKALGMGGIETRRDPQLDIRKIDESLIRSAYDAAAQYSAFSVNKLRESYDKAAEEGKLYKDHLVLRVRRGDPVINFNEPHDAKFDKKVIFIIEDGAKLDPGGRFYHCTEKSSTLIYAGPGNALLEQFGSSGHFRGLIYVDSLNTAGNSFNWKTGSSIDGAVHIFSDRDFRWNTGSNNSISVRYNEDVLSAFGSLVKGAASGGEESASFVDESDKRIHLRPVGFYYY